MEDIKKITIADAFVIYTLLKGAFLGDMETSDKMRLIDTMSNFRKVVLDFDEYKMDVKQKIPEEKGDERIKMFTEKAAEKISMPEVKKISEDAFGTLMNINKDTLNVEHLVMLKDILC